MKKTTIFLVLLIALWTHKSIFLATPAIAVLYEFDNPSELNDWELGPGAQAEIQAGKLILTTDGSNTGLFYAGVEKPEELTDYELEVFARKIGDDSKYFHLFVRTVEPTKNFYFVEVSYNSNTISMFQFTDGAANEITPGGNAGRPKRPESQDTQGGDAYTFKFEVEGETLKYSVDGRLSIATRDKTWERGPPGLGGRGSRIEYEWVRIDGVGIPPTSTGIIPLIRFSEVETIGPGQLFTVEVVIKDITNLAGWQLSLLFDPEILEATQVIEGDFFKKEGSDTFFQGGNIDNTQGEISSVVAATLITDGGNGTGTLLTVTFKAKKAGESILALQNIKLGRPSGQSIPHQVIPGKVTVIDFLPWDVNQDKKVDIFDLILIARNFEQQPPQNPRADVNKDDTVDIFDIIAVVQHFGESTSPAAPSVVQMPGVQHQAMIERWLRMAQQINDPSAAFQRGIVVLEHLLYSIVPQQTTLLPNYPNPFNPETWIPYQLAKNADVRLAIYDIKGAVVRQLNLGHQRAGYYVDRDSAAYWDGRSAIGERVASGVYFYQLQAGDFTAVKRMAILK